MKNMNQKRNKQGQTLLEIIAVLVIIGAILAAVIPAVTASTDSGRVASALNTIRSIQSAAVGYYNDNNGTYASIAIGTPSTPGLVPKYLPTNFTGTGANPWGGDITVGPGTLTNQYVVTLTQVPTTVQSQLINALQNTSISATPNGTTVTATFS